jgi:hypothetical protein
MAGRNSPRRIAWAQHANVSHPTTGCGRSLIASLHVGLWSSAACPWRWRNSASQVGDIGSAESARRRIWEPGRVMAYYSVMMLLMLTVVVACRLLVL